MEVYHELGWVTLPIKANAKMPYIKGWQSKTSDDNEYLKTVFKETDNVGVLTGKVSGIMVIDVDVKRTDGMKTLSDLEQEYGELPHTVKAKTPSGGVHLYFKYPQGITLVNKCPVGESIDIQADGSQCVIYPSNIFGKYYEWENDPKSTAIADLPQPWVDLLTKQKGLTVAGKRFTMPTIIADGNRNIKLTQVAGHIIGTRKFTKSEALDELSRANHKICNPPLDDEEVLTIFDSIWSTQEKTTMNEYMEKLNTIVERKDEPIIEHTPSTGIESWYVVDEKGKSQFHDEQFITWFVKDKNLVKYDGIVYTQDRQLVDDDVLGEWIVRCIGTLFINGTLQPLVSKLVKLVPLYVPKLSQSENVHEVHFKNKSFNVKSGELKEIKKKFSITLIPHDYNPDAKCPTWDKFISELFSEEDARTFQQYMGYCLTPSTRAQVGLFICGKGGEGKSRITPIMHSIFEGTVHAAKLKTVAEYQFGLAALQHKLVFLDDDMDMNAFTQTDKLKELITTETTMEINQKNKAIKNVKLYARVLGIGNGFPKSIYDTTDGWNRRIHPIVTKPKPLDRPVDPNFSDKLMLELDGIIAWAVRGLLDFINNGQKIYTSESTAEIKKALVANNGDSLTDFIESGAITFTNNPEDYVTHKEFSHAYNEYCFENDMAINKGIPTRMVQYRQLAEHEPKLANTLSKRIGENKKAAKVYIGVVLND